MLSAIQNETELDEAYLEYSWTWNVLGNLFAFL